MNQKLEAAKNAIRDVIDFPKEGIVFKDITTLLQDPVHLNTVAEHLCEYYAGKGITKVVGLESRGFILGALIANRLGAGFVPIRKPGKFPYGVFSEKYTLEYGFDEIQIHKDALEEGDVVLLHDDLLATGGTAKASLSLINNFPVKEIFMNFIIELDFLEGRDKLNTDYELYSLFHF